jgi:hypothetical protein
MRYRLRTLLIVLALGPFVLYGLGEQVPAIVIPTVSVASSFVGTTVGTTVGTLLFFWCFHIRTVLAGTAFGVVFFYGLLLPSGEASFLFQTRPSRPIWEDGLPLLFLVLGAVGWGLIVGFMFAAFARLLNTPTIRNWLTRRRLT